MNNKPYIDFGIKWGIIVAIIYIALHYTMLFAAPDFAFSGGQLIMLGLILALMVIIGLQARKIAGGVLLYKHAYIALLFVAIVSTFIFTAADFIVKNYVDTSLVETEKKLALEKTAKMMENWGAPEDKIDETMEEMQARDFKPTVISSLGRFVGGVVINALIILIIAAIVKKKPKDTLPTPEPAAS